MLRLPKAAPIGIDVDGRAMSAVQLRSRSRNALVARAVSVLRPDPAVEVGDGEIAEFVQVLSRHGFWGRGAVLALSPEQVITDLIVMPSAAEAVDADSVRERLGPLPDEMETAWWTVPGGDRDSTRVGSAACSHADAARLIDPFEAAGLSVEAIDMRSWACTRVCAATAAAAGWTGLVELAWSATRFVAIAQGAVVYERAFADGGLHGLHEALCADLGLDDDVAAIALGPDGEDIVPGPSLRSALETYIERVRAELAVSMAYAEEQCLASACTDLVVTGDGADVPAIMRRFAVAVETPARRLAPRDLTRGVPADAPWADMSRLVPALGLARYWSAS